MRKVGFSEHMIPTIELVNIRKVYESGGEARVEALRGVSLSIMKGDFVAIMGTSGSGKSTLMNILGCLDRPTAGEYRFEGSDISKMDKPSLAKLRNLKLGFVFQGFNLLKRHSAAENVELPLLYAGVSPRERRRRAIAMLELVGLKERIHHHPNKLSGGQQQRVAIARALVNDPQIILADEPTGNLDSKTTSEILAELQRLNRVRGQTIILVTHEQDVADHAGRVIVVKDGLITQDYNNSNPMDALKKPESKNGVHHNGSANGTNQPTIKQGEGQWN